MQPTRPGSATHIVPLILAVVFAVVTGLPPGRLANACTPIEQWVWDGPVRSPADPEVCATPLVVQLTDDNGDFRADALDFPDIVFTHFDDRVSGYPARISAVDGRTGADLFTISGHQVELSGLAAGDLDADGSIDLVAIEFGGGRLLAFERTGALKWRGPPIASPLGQLDAIALADLDGNGRSEILIGASVFNDDGSLRWRGTGGGGGLTSHIVHAHDVDPTSPGLEVVAGNTLYASDGSILLRKFLQDGPTVVADLDGDRRPEIVLASNDTVYVYDPTGVAIGAPYVFTGFGTAAQPAAADVDGDGIAEVIVAHSQDLVALRLGPTGLELVWRVAIADATGSAAPSAFDFDGDGRVDVVFHDEHDWFLIDGATGGVLSQLPFPSDTGLELAVIADIDNDCRTEIVLGGCRRAPEASQLRAFECPTGPTARALWNQHSYHVTNIADDFSIPAVPDPAWLAGAGFAAQSERTSDAVADAGPPQEVCAGQSVRLDGSGSVPCDGAGLRYRWLTGAIELCPWSTDPTCLVTPTATTIYTLEIECLGGICPRVESALTLVTIIVDATPESVGNSLRGIRVDVDADLSWAAALNATTYALFRSEFKETWPPLPHRDLVPSTTVRLPDVPWPSRLYFYRIAGRSCGGLLGP